MNMLQTPGNIRRSGMSAFVVMKIILFFSNILKPLLFLNTTAVQ